MVEEKKEDVEKKEEKELVTEPQKKEETPEPIVNQNGQEGTEGDVEETAGIEKKDEKEDNSAPLDDNKKETPGIDSQENIAEEKPDDPTAVPEKTAADPLEEKMGAVADKEPPSSDQEEKEEAKDTKKEEVKEAAKEIKPVEKEKAEEISPALPLKKKKINKMTLTEIEQKLKEIEQQQRGTGSKYARQLLRRKKSLGS